MIYELEANTTLYTMMAAIPAQAMKAVCEAGVCRKLWRGEKEGIFRISKKTCVGDEIGWQFLKEVMCKKINFEGFCTGKTSVYQTLLLGGKFRTSKTFGKWFLAWSSHQEVDFRKACFACGS